jgi:hypothetical protein
LAGLETGADQLHGRKVRAAHGQDVGEPDIGEYAARTVAAQQQAIAGDEVEIEEIGLNLVDAVEGLKDQIAVRVGAGLVGGDPPLVDQRLDQGVVAGELTEFAPAEQIGPAVPDVADPDPVAVEERDRRGGAGAVECGLLLDQLDDPVVSAMQGAGDQGQQIGVGWLLVEAPDLLDGGARGEIAPGGPADAVADGQ